MTTRSRVISTPRDLENLRDAWEALETSLPFNPFLTYAWTSAAWTHLDSHDPSASLHVISLEDSHGLAAILPLVHRQRKRFYRLEPPGVELVDRTGVLSRLPLPSTLAGIAKHLAELASSWDALILPRALEGELRVSSDSDPDLVLRRWRDGVAPYLPLGPDPLYARSRKTRKNILYARRKLEELGWRTRMETSPSAGDVASWFPLSNLRKHSARPTDDHRHEALFGDLIGMLGPRHRIYLAVLENDERIGAFEWGFRDERRLSVYDKGYEPDLARLSPGSVLLLDTLTEARRMGLEEYDFLSGAEEYKYQWTERARATETLLLTNQRLKSQLAGALMRWRRE